MSESPIPTDAPAVSLSPTLLPIMGAVFLAFLVIGLALPTLPLHVHDGLGLGSLAVGIVAGAQFAASLISRVWAGDFAYGRGAKRAVVLGLAAALAAWLVYLASVSLTDRPELSATILVLGRAVLV